MKRDTTLATEVQRTSGFIPVNTVPRLHVAVNEKSQRQYTQQTTKKRSAKSSCRVFHKHLCWYKLSAFSIPFLTRESFVQLLWCLCKSFYICWTSNDIQRFRVWSSINLAYNWLALPLSTYVYHSGSLQSSSMLSKSESS